MNIGVELDPGWAWDDKIPLAQAVKIGNFLYISGQIALDPDGNLIGAGDMKAQSQKVFDNIEAIVKSAGGSVKNLIKITTYLTDMDRYPEFNEIRMKIFKDYRPASTTVGVTALAFKGLLVEVEAVAYI